MGIKLSYVILKTFCSIKNINFNSISGFDVSDNGIIRANKNLSFVLEDDKINMKKMESGKLFLPQNFQSIKIYDDTLPNYVVSAI